MADPRELNEWSILLAKVAGTCVALGGLFVGGWGWLRRMARAIRLSDHWHDRFGNRPVDAVETLLNTMEKSEGIADLQREILQQHLNLGIYVCDPSGQLIYANGVLCEMFGLDSSEMQGYGWLAAVVDDERSQAFERWKLAVENGYPYEDTYTIKLDSGETRRLHTKAYVRVTDDDAAAHVVVAYVGYGKWDD